jgi:hypothetical protein
LPLRFLAGLVIGLVAGGINHYLLLLAVKKAAAGGKPAQLLGRYLMRYLVDFAVFACVYLLFRDPLAIGGTLLGLLTVLVVGLWLYIRRERGANLG